MNKTNISVLGSGWLGLPFAEHLVAHGCQVKLSTRSTGKLAILATSGATAYLVDIEDEASLSNGFLADADILVCNITSKNRAAYDKLISHIARSNIKQVLFVSSSSVYRNVNRLVTEDEQAENPNSLLYQVEQAFQACIAFETTILRLSGLVGYCRHPGRFFANGKVVPQPEAPINLIHRDDCIAILWQIITQQAWGQVFNGCSDSHPTKRVFYSHCRALLDKASPTFAETETSESAYKIVSNNKIKKQLGYQFIHPDLMQTAF